MKSLAFAILFLTGYNFAVPGYQWAVAIQPVHAVFLDNILLLVYLMLFGVPSGLARRSDAVVYAGMIAVLAALGVISPALNPTRLEDLGQAARLLLLAAYTLWAVQWTRRWGPTFLLRALLLGLGVGGALNVYVSFAHPYLETGFLPVLYARNGTGGPLSLAIALCAWLFMLRRSSWDSATAAVVSLVGVVAAMISFSKTAMLIGLCGLAAWLFVVVPRMTGRGVRRGLVALVIVAAGGSAYAAQSEAVSGFIDSFQYSLSIKFAGAALQKNDAASTQWRYQYFWGVAEILSKYPVTGVGGSGFYEAIIATEPFAAGLMSNEDPAARTQGGANPHNSFLYFAAANGVPGLLLAVALYAGFLFLLRRRLVPFGIAGHGLFGCLALGYFIFGMTLPNLFNTMVMYLPVAVAIGLGLRERSPVAVHGRSMSLPTELAPSPAAR